MEPFRRIIILLWFIFSRVLEASIECEFTLTCEEVIRPGSTCVNGICTNPFAEGCLRRIEGSMHSPSRICNSEDRLTNSSSLCSESPFAYPEIRIVAGNWDSSIFYTWILQIILSELADVPTSIELSGEGSLNFYDVSNGFSYANLPYNFDALKEANKVDDCSTSDKPCGHLMPELWEYLSPTWESAVEEGYIERPSFDGILGRTGFYTPDFVIDKYPSFTSSLGLSGEENRKKLAEIFKRPTTWGDYCKFVSISNCLEIDDIARGPPLTQDEVESYFVDGLFKGHFRDTDDSNCTLNPDTCAGNFVDYPCDWDDYVISQMYWNEIALESKGPLDANGYSYDQAVQIFKAANQTQSPVIIVWWEPEPMIHTYGFTRISFPKPTLDCINNRPNIFRCGLTINGTVDKKKIEELVGDPRGSCDYDYSRAFSIRVSSLRTSTLSTPEPLRSPAYEIIKNTYITADYIDEILNDWKSGTDPREAACTWAAKNVDLLKGFVPKGYPRKIQDVEDVYSIPFRYAGIAFGTFVSLSVVMAIVMTAQSLASAQNWYHEIATIDISGGFV